MLDFNPEAFQVDALPSRMVLDDVHGKAPVGEYFLARGALVLDGRQVLLPHVAADVPFVSGALAAKQAYKTQVALPHLFGHQEPQIILSAIYNQNNERALLEYESLALYFSKTILKLFKSTPCHVGCTFFTWSSNPLFLNTLLQAGHS